MFGWQRPQVSHGPPKVPHALGWVPGWQTPAMSQHPMAHVCEQPMPPSMPVPPSVGVHRPASQVSPAWHFTHRSPPMPHAAVVVVTKHWLSAVQQPLGQVADEQRTSQRFEKHSLFWVRQLLQAAPPVPHAFEATPTLHEPLSQQPVQPGHAPASALPPAALPPALPPPVACAHTPFVHAPLQATHAAPLVPHAVESVPATHAPDDEQHPAHDAPQVCCPHARPTTARNPAVTITVTTNALLPVLMAKQRRTLRARGEGQSHGASSL